MEPVVRTGPVMGTVASIHVHGASPERVHPAVDAVFAELERLEQMFSTFRPTSEISRLNRGERSLYDCSPEVLEVLDACTWLEHESGGAFTAHPPHDPGRIDPAGFVKGWAAERAAARLTEAGLTDWYVNVGGDLLARGRPEPDRFWRIAVSDPIRRDAVLATIELPDGGAVATSGTAERGEHLWSGAEAGIAARLVAVTVTGPELTWADAFATTVFALGDEGLDWLAGRPGYEGFAVWEDHQVRRSSRFTGHVFGVVDDEAAS